MDTSETQELWLTTSDNHRLYTRWHIPEASQGIVLLIHGLGEHSGRYDHIVDVFQERHIGVVRFDLRGHGRSTGQRGHARNYLSFLNDVTLVVDRMREEFPVRPLIVYGHSMGGGIVANWCLRCTPEQHHVIGAVLSAPWFTLTTPPPAWQVFAIKNMARIWPWFTIPTRFRTKDLTTDPEAIQDYKHDPLKHKRITVNLAYTCHIAGQWALDHAEEFPVPVLLIHGLKDQITSPGGTSLFDQLAPNSKLLLFKEMVHETHNEPGWENVVNQAADWLIQQFELHQVTPDSPAQIAPAEAEP